MSKVDDGDSLKQQMAAEYAAGAKVADLLKRYPFGQTFAYDYLRSVHPIRWDQRKVNAARRSEMIGRYRAGESTVAIGRAFGLGPCTVRRHILAAGIALRNSSECQRRHAVNESAFDAVTGESAYWAGFMITDGCVSGNEVLLTLSKKDRGHLEKFRSFLKSSHPICDSENSSGFGGGPSSRFSVKSAKLVKSLGAMGVIPRKTHVAKAVDALAWNRHFWRGAVDGDGGIPMTHGARRYPMLHLCSASRELIDQFASFCSTIVPGHRVKVKRSHVWNVLLPGSIAVPVIRVLYSDHCVSLDRKQSRAEEAMRYRFRSNCAVKTSVSRSEIQGRLDEVGNDTDVDHSG